MGKASHLEKDEEGAKSQTRLRYRKPEAVWTSGLRKLRRQRPYLRWRSAGGARVASWRWIGFFSKSCYTEHRSRRFPRRAPYWWPSPTQTSIISGVAGFWSPSPAGSCDNHPPESQTRDEVGATTAGWRVSEGNLGGEYNYSDKWGALSARPGQYSDFICPALRPRAASRTVKAQQRW